MSNIIGNRDIFCAVLRVELLLILTAVGMQVLYDWAPYGSRLERAARVLGRSSFTAAFIGIAILIIVF